jgi:hypothetical protein
MTAKLVVCVSPAGVPVAVEATPRKRTSEAYPETVAQTRLKEAQERVIQSLKRGENPIDFFVMAVEYHALKEKEDRAKAKLKDSYRRLGERRAN